MELGDLDWQVELRDVFIRHPVTGEPILVPDRKAVTRIRDNKPLGVVGDKYRPIQNREAFSFLEGVMADKECRWETAISVRGGATIAGIVSCADSDIEIVQGDHHFLYLTVINTHDGSSACKVFPTDVRVVCANTVQAALNSRNRGLTVNVRHSGDIQSKLQMGRDILSKARADYLRFAEWQRRLAETEATKDKVEELLNELFPEVDETKTKTTRAKTIRDNKIAGLLETVKIEQALLPQWTETGGANTALLWFNSITHWVDHTVANKKDNIAEYAMVGGGNDFKLKAIETMANVFDVPLLVGQD